MKSNSHNVLYIASQSIDASVHIVYGSRLRKHVIAPMLARINVFQSTATSWQCDNFQSGCAYSSNSDLCVRKNWEFSQNIWGNFLWQSYDHCLTLVTGGFFTDPNCQGNPVSTAQPAQTITVCPSPTQSIQASSISTQPQYCSGELTRVFLVSLITECDLRLKSAIFCSMIKHFAKFFKFFVCNPC